HSRPHGSRLLPDPANLNQVTTLHSIQQPDDYFGGRIEVLAANLNQVRLVDVDATGGFNNANDFPVHAGDYIEIKGTGLLRRITAAPARLSATSSVLTVSPPFPAAIARAPA